MRSELALFLGRQRNKEDAAFVPDPGLFNEFFATSITDATPAALSRAPL